MNKVERETIDARIDDIKTVLQEKHEFLSVVEMVNVLNSLKSDLKSIQFKQVNKLMAVCCGHKQVLICLLISEKL